jgi:hypothetical protein
MWQMLPDNVDDVERVAGAGAASNTDVRGGAARLGWQGGKIRGLRTSQWCATPRLEAPSYGGVLQMPISSVSGEVANEGGVSLLAPDA